MNFGSTRSKVFNVASRLTSNQTLRAIMYVGFGSMLLIDHRLTYLVDILMTKYTLSSEVR